MPAADNVAVVALVVSLIALLIASLQLLQALLGSVEGYWRCGEGVIGPWAKRRHRVIHLWELRVETTYITPEIDLLPSTRLRGSSSADYDGRAEELYPLNPTPSDVTTDEIRLTVADGTSTKYRPKWTSGNLVTWISLLQQLHATYDHYYPSDSQHILAVEPPPTLRARKKSRRLALPNLTSIMWQDTNVHYDSQVPTNSERTEIATRYRHNSWDFMPPDVVRPLASTRLGPLVVMTARLGMHWEALDPGNETLRASGNGYSLTPTRVRGLGMVVQFNKYANTMRQSNYIPSEASDKMICGILPTSRELPGDPRGNPNSVQDYPLKSDAGVMSHEALRKLLNDLLISQEISDVLVQSEYRKFQDWWQGNWHRPQCNEALVLLCPFMPVQGSHCRRIRFLSWSGKKPCATFNYIEGRMILLSEIGKRCTELNQAKASLSVTTHFEAVKAALGKLEADFPENWYADGHNIVAESFKRPHVRPGNKGSDSQLVAVCRQMFNDTTAFFEKLACEETQGGLSIPYRLLVAAHVTFGFGAAKAAEHDLKAKEDRKERTSGCLYFDERQVWPHPEDMTPKTWRVVGGAKNIVDVAWYYVLQRDQFVDEVLRRGSAIGYPKPERSHDQRLRIEAAWRMLVLRGFAWFLSIEIETPFADIPSSHYSSQTQVWIA